MYFVHVFVACFVRKTSLVRYTRTRIQVQILLLALMAHVTRPHIDSWLCYIIPILSEIESQTQ